MTYVSDSHELALLGGLVKLFNGDTGVFSALHLDETKTTRLA